MARRQLIREVPLEERIALTETKDITLDGKPAVISGYLNDFATIRRKDGRGGDVQFAWATAARIVSTHRNFQS